MKDHLWDLAILLRLLGVACGFPQLAGASGVLVARSTYSNYELGKTSPGLDSLRVLARIYAIPLEAFLYPEEYRTLEAARQRPPKKVKLAPAHIGELSSKERELIAKLRAKV